ncbi:MAG: TrkH family potassium uptake protein [Bacteroidales bacterium]|nr:TrkH family potassium uptake protein [Bacteroidales bacterium]
MKSIHIPLVLNIVGICLIIESLFIAIDIPISLIYNDGTLIPLIESFGITMIFGLIIFYITKSKLVKKPSIKESFLIVTFSWLFISLFGTLPYILSSSIPSFIDSFFETVSGFTTTGSSVVNDIEALPKSILFWRSETHWIGGMGIIALVVVLLPYLKVSGHHLFSAEGSFFSNEKTHPRLINVAKRLWGTYILLTLFETLALMLAKMNWFDAICHSFATIATGGFSTKNSSIAEYSATIQYIITLFMFLSGMNFILHISILNGKFKRILKNEEWRMYVIIVVGVTLILTFSNFDFYNNIEHSFRQSLFQVVSIITATGFISENYELWPQFSILITFLIMFVGACVGSTGGGIKIARHIILIKSFKIQFQKLLHPNAITPIRYNKKIISEKGLNSISSFIIIYFLTFIFGSFVMMATGLDVKSASSSVITTLGGIGPGLGLVGPVNNFADISAIGKGYLSFNMILGRLEIISVLSLFTRNFYKV